MKTKTAPAATSTPRAAGAAPARKRHRCINKQPFDLLKVDGALLHIQTLEALSGRSRSTLYRDAAQGLLTLVKIGARCTRVRAECAREYLKNLGTN